MIAPRGGFFDRDGKWAVENEGVAPDIDVENWPKDVIAGRDPQLERAVEEAMRLLKANPVNRMTTEPRAADLGQAKGFLSPHMRFSRSLSIAILTLMTAVPDAQQWPPQAPVAKQVPRETKIHGYTLTRRLFLAAREDQPGGHRSTSRRRTPTPRR